MDINSADIGSAKKKAELERDNYKAQLDGATASLKEFEGVDVKDLQGKISTLTDDLQKKETEYQNKLFEMEFNSVRKGAVSDSRKAQYSSFME